MVTYYGTNRNVGHTSSMRDKDYRERALYEADIRDDPYRKWQRTQDKTEHPLWLWEMGLMETWDIIYFN